MKHYEIEARLSYKVQILISLIGKSQHVQYVTKAIRLISSGFLYEQIPGVDAVKSDRLKILEYRNAYVVVNEAGKYCNHTHLKKRSTCELLIKLIKRKEVPRSSYLRQSAKRVTLDQDYITAINHKIEKDKRKPRYYNKGGRI